MPGAVGWRASRPTWLHRALRRAARKRRWPASRIFAAVCAFLHQVQAVPGRERKQCYHYPLKWRGTAIAVQTHHRQEKGSDCYARKSCRSRHIDNRTEVGREPMPIIIDRDCHISSHRFDGLAITTDELIHEMDRAGVDKALVWLKPPYNSSTGRRSRRPPNTPISPSSAARFTRSRFST